MGHKIFLLVSAPWYTSNDCSVVVSRNIDWDCRYFFFVSRI